MRFSGTVTNRTELAAGQGHSQVRISGHLDVNADGQGDHPCELIISTPAMEIIDAFKVNQRVDIDLTASDPVRVAASSAPKG